MRLPAVSPEVLSSFEQAFTAKRSEKDQRNLIRKLLFNSGGGPCERPLCQSSMDVAEWQWQNTAEWFKFFELHTAVHGMWAYLSCIQ